MADKLYYIDRRFKIKTETIVEHIFRREYSMRKKMRKHLILPSALLIALVVCGTVSVSAETAEIKSRFRLIAATNRDLWKEVREKRFRQDLPDTAYPLVPFASCRPCANESRIFCRLSTLSFAIPASVTVKRFFLCRRSRNRR